VTYEELVKKIRIRLDDVTLPYLWESSELYDYILESLQEILVDTCLLSSSFSSEITADSRYVELKSGYLLDDDLSFKGEVFTVDEDEVFFDTTPLTLLPREWTRSNADSGDPRWYYLKRGRLYVYPPPSEDGTVYYEGFYNITSIEDKESEILLPKRHQSAIIPGVMAKAYMKPDSDTFYPKKALESEALFKQKIDKIKQDIMFMERNPKPTEIHEGLL
jgi:hypothetical protein